LSGIQTHDSIMTAQTTGSALVVFYSSFALSIFSFRKK